MARKKREPEAKPAAGWITTFSDLMNLLLCFFVLLFSMSTVDAEKFQMVIASLQSSLSIMPAGSMSIGEGEMVGNGISQLPNIDVFFETSSGEDGDSQGGKTEETETETDVAEQYKEQALAESEQMAEQIEQQNPQVFFKVRREAPQQHAGFHGTIHSFSSPLSHRS